MESWRKDARREAIIVDLEALVPQDHLLRKIEKVMDRDKSYTQPIFGKSIWIWQSRYERHSVQKIFMHSAKRRLSVSLQMQKKSTQCDIHTTEAWPQSHDGSGLNMLP